MSTNAEGANAAEAERARIDECLRGSPVALGEFRDQHQETLRRILAARGASPTEAEDTLADLWADCVPVDDEHRGLL